jgi:hypothetical protein
LIALPAVSRRALALATDSGRTDVDDDAVLRKRQSLQLYGQIGLRMQTIRRDLGLPAFRQHDATTMR